MKNRFQWNLILLACVLLLFFLNGYQHTLKRRPFSVHQWRQSDCLSIAKNYYEEGFHFFSPVIHYQGVPGGRAVSELPVLNYTAACLWKLFGEHELIYRLMVYLFLIAAVFTLFNLLLDLGVRGPTALTMVIFLLTSPLLTYYGFNFLSDVPALSLSIISLCHLYRFHLGKGERHFYIALALSVLAVFMKASAVFAFGVTLLVAFDLLRGRGKLTSRTLVIACSLFLISLIVMWYRFALRYNGGRENHVFLLTILPIWEMSSAEIAPVTRTLFTEFFPLFLNKVMLFVTALAVLYVSVNLKRLDIFCRCIFLLSAVYFVALIVLFYRVFDVHEYYLINAFVFPVVTYFCSALLLSRGTHSANLRATGLVLVSGIAVFSVVHSAAIQRLRTMEGSSFNEWYPFISEEQKGGADYTFWRYSLGIKKTEALTPVLRKHGISRSDFVLSIPDGSFNISLYLMDQKGFTVAPDHIASDSLVMDQFMHRVKYVVLSDTTLKSLPAFRRNRDLMEPAFTDNGVEVYKVRS